MTLFYTLLLWLRAILYKLLFSLNDLSQKCRRSDTCEHQGWASDIDLSFGHEQFDGEFDVVSVSFEESPEDVTCFKVQFRNLKTGECTPSYFLFAINGRLRLISPQSAVGDFDMDTMICDQPSCTWILCWCQAVLKQMALYEAFLSIWGHLAPAKSPLLRVREFGLDPNGTR